MALKVIILFITHDIVQTDRLSSLLYTPVDFLLRVFLSYSHFPKFILKSLAATGVGVLTKLYEYNGSYLSDESFTSKEVDIL